MKTFSKPLTAEEEAVYIGLLQNPDEQIVQEAREMLIIHNMRLVTHVIKKYSNSFSDMEEMTSIGFLGLIKGVRSFKPDKGSKLGTYAAKCIENEVLMMLRGRKKTSREVSLYEPIGMDKEGNEVKLLDIIESEQRDITEEIQTQNDIQFLHKILCKTLNQRELEIISYRYGMAGGEEMTQREIGQMLGISRSYVSRIEKKALEKLRDEFLNLQTGAMG